MDTTQAKRSHAKKWWKEQVYTGSDVDELLDELDAKAALIAKYEAALKELKIRAWHPDAKWALEIAEKALKGDEK